MEEISLLDSKRGCKAFVNCPIMCNFIGINRRCQAIKFLHQNFGRHMLPADSGQYSRKVRMGRIWRQSAFAAQFNDPWQIAGIDRGEDKKTAHGRACPWAGTFPWKGVWRPQSTSRELLNSKKQRESGGCRP